MDVNSVPKVLLKRALLHAALACSLLPSICSPAKLLSEASEEGESEASKECFVPA